MCSCNIGDSMELFFVGIDLLQLPTPCYPFYCLYISIVLWTDLFSDANDKIVLLSEAFICFSFLSLCRKDSAGNIEFRVKKEFALTFLCQSDRGICCSCFQCQLPQDWQEVIKGACHRRRRSQGESMGDWQTKCNTGQFLCPLLGHTPLSNQLIAHLLSLLFGPFQMYIAWFCASSLLLN